MAENNITSMIITVVISMVVVGVVMIPIFNGIAKDNGGDDGDGGSGEVTGTYQYGTITIQSVDELTLLMENPPEFRTEYNEGQTEVSVISDGEVVATLPITDTESDIALLPLMYYRYTIMLSPEGAQIVHGANEIGSEAWTYLTYGSDSEIVTVNKGWVKDESVEVYRQSGGETGLSPDRHDVFGGVIEEVGATVSLIEEIDMEIIYLQENGDYVYAEGLDFDSLSSEAIVMGYNRDERRESPADWDEWVVVLGYDGAISGLTSDTVTYATAHNVSGSIQPTEPLEITSTNPISVSVEFEDGHVSTFTIDSAIIPVGGSGGGSSSDSGSSDLGTAGTIIAIIPVFVILAILMGAVGLLYQNRKAI